MGQHNALSLIGSAKAGAGSGWQDLLLGTFDKVRWSEPLVFAAQVAAYGD
jgi:hypothetical protein